MMIKRTPLDAVITDLVRERANWTCERCCRDFPYGVKTKELHCSHYYGRKFNSTRHHPDNVFCLCATCHRELEDDHESHVFWVRRQLGDVRYGELRESWRRICKRTKAEKAEMLAHFRAELVRLKDARMNGEVHRLDFMGWD